MKGSTSRFQPFSPPSLRTSGLRRLKTAFASSPASTSASVSSMRSLASTPRSSPGSIGYASTSTSPASSECGCDHPHHSVGSAKGLQLMGLDQALEEGMPKIQEESSARKRLRALLMLRRKRVAGKWDGAMEEEIKIAGERGVRMFEPRENSPIVMASIFEVMSEVD